MNAVQRTLQLIVDQLKGLTSTAKLLIGSLMVILTMTLFLVAQFAGRPSMVPLPIDAGPDSRAAAIAYLERSGTPHKESDGRLLVPVEQRYTILARLTDHDVISGDQIKFDWLIENDSPFLTRDQNERRWLVAKMNVLSAIISRFDGIKRAQVVIDKPRETGFGPTHVRPTASVSVVPRGDGLSRNQVEAIAHVVASAQQGMRVEDVRVIDAKRGSSHQAPGAEDMTPGKYLDVQRAAEKHVKATISDLLAYIPGVRIGVNAQMATRREEIRSERYEEPKVGTLKGSSRDHGSTSDARTREAGVAANMGIALSAAAERGTQLGGERTAKRAQTAVPRGLRHTTDPKGYALEINATILVPRSYFLSVYRLVRNEPAAAPTDAELEPVVTAEKTRIKSTVLPLVDTGAFDDAVPGTVVVSMIPDLATMASAHDLPPASGPSMVAATGGPSGGAFGGSLPTGLIKYVGLGTLALLSLFMMFLMVRRAGIHAELPTADDVVGVPPPLPTGQSDVVGQAEESTAAAPAAAVLDHKALRRKQMLKQISDMVKHDPDEVANLLRSWVKAEA